MKKSSRIAAARRLAIYDYMLTQARGSKLEKGAARAAAAKRFKVDPKTVDRAMAEIAPQAAQIARHWPTLVATFNGAADLLRRAKLTPTEAAAFGDSCTPATLLYAEAKVRIADLMSEVADLKEKLKPVTTRAALRAAGLDVYSGTKR